jgi:hypothetical protein
MPWPEFTVDMRVHQSLILDQQIAVVTLKRWVVDYAKPETK